MQNKVAQLGSLLSQEFMRLRRILSPGLKATLFQKRACKVAATGRIFEMSRSDTA